MKIRVEITGPHACGKTYIANLIADLIEREALGTEYTIVSSLGGIVGPSKTERRGTGRTPPVTQDNPLLSRKPPRRLMD